VASNKIKHVKKLDGEVASYTELCQSSVSKTSIY